MSTANDNPRSKNLHYLGLGISLGWQDVQDNYKRTVLGPWWITLGLGVQIAAISVIFGSLFSIENRNFVPHLAVGIVLWNFLGSLLNDGAQAFISSQNLVKLTPIPSYLPMLRVLSRSVTVLAHHVIVIVVALWTYGVTPMESIFSSAVGLILFSITLSSVGFILGVTNSRFRDIAPMVSALLTVMFYVTPIIWMRSSLPEGFAGTLVKANPLFHLFEVVRGPLIGEAVEPYSWVAAAVLCVIFVLLAVGVAKKYSRRVAYWI